MILQILSDGAISANWVMVIVIAVCGFLLVRILNRLEKRQDSMEGKQVEHGQILVRHEERHEGHDEKLKTLENMSSEYRDINQKLSTIMTKIRAAS